MNARESLTLITVLMAVLIAALGAAAQTPDAGTLTHDGITRDYLITVPDGLSAPAPLVVVLHGGGSTAAMMRRETDFDALAWEHGFIAVYPNGVSREWNERRGSGMTVRRSTADDVGFLTALIDHLSARYAIDGERIYAMGISNGGFMALRLACDVGERLAGIGVAAAQFTRDMLDTCRPARPLRVAIFNGTDDPIVPFDGGPVIVSGQFRGTVEPTEATVAFWLAANACAPAPDAVDRLDARPLDQTVVVIRRYDRCAPGGAVRLYRIEGGGHTLPGGTQYLPRERIGAVSRELHAPTALWAFWMGAD